MSHESVQARAIFIDAVENVAPERWREYLDEVCGADETLRDKVQRLLDAHGAIGSFMDKPAAAPVATIDQPITEKPGTQIGPYKLLQQVGEGGMGVVYMAEQKEPVKRRVALKIIKPGMDTRQVIARFEAERQALAMMDHPNIAKVLDAGQTESGRPYFVMELVKGVPVTQYCDEQHLNPKERLELFIPVCQAVQHAHQKGIIHRDIKPSNILIALFDGQPVPKVIDFGVAKATSQTLTEKTMFTQLGQVVGTLEYMSPEQAQVNQLDIDTRSDIYSLGVLLYELLTGETPFDRTTLRSAAFDEMLRIIREEEPSKPSTKVSSSETLASIAANRRIDAHKLGTMIRGELDWIVMKALEKDRARRYETASKFAEDVLHYLNDEAVVACPPSARYRLNKFIRRNRPLIATGTVVAAVLVVGLAATTWQAIRASRALEQVSLERDRAIAAERLAEERYEIAADSVKRYLYEVSRDQELQDGEFWVLRQRLLKSAVPFYEKLIEQEANSLDAKLSKALSLDELWRLNFYFFDDFEAARDRAHAAIQLLDQCVKEKPQDEVLLKALANSHTHMAMASGKLGQSDLARTHLEAAFAIAERMAKHNPDDPDVQYAFAIQCANQSHDLADAAEAVRLHKDAMKIFGRLASRFPDKRAYRDSWSYFLDAWGNLHSDIEALQESLEIRRNLVEDFPDVAKLSEFVGTSLTSLGRWHARNSDNQQAIEHHQEALKIRAELVRQIPKPLYKRNLGETHLSLANIKANQGEVESAVESYRLAIEADPDHAAAYHNLGIMLKRNGDLVAAIEKLRKAIELEPGIPLFHDNLGGALKANGNLSEAIVYEKRAAELDPDNAIRHGNLAWTLATTTDLEVRNAVEAVTHAKKAVQLEPERANHWSNLGVANYRNGDWQDSVNVLEKAHSLAKSGDLFHRFFLAMAYSKLGEEEKGRLYYREALGYWHEKKRGSKQLQRFRDEAEEVLGITAKDRANLLVSHYGEVIHRDPENWKALRARGDLFRDAKQWKEAIADYTAALKGEPQDAYLFNARSICHCNLKDFAAALEDSNKAIEIDPQSWMYSHRAWPLSQLSRYEEAIADCNLALKLNPNNATAMQRRGLAHQYLSNYRAAVTDNVAALKLNASSSYAWKRLPFCARKVKTPEDLAALDELHQHLKTDAKSLSSRAESLAEIYLIRAKLFANGGDAENAIADSETASEIAPASPLPFNFRGELHVAAGEWKEAILAYSRALELEQTDTTAIQWLGICMRSSGDEEAYRKHCREMLRRHAATENRAVAGAVARCFTYQSWPEADLETPLALARLAADQSKSDAWDQYCYGALLYRVGRYEEAHKQLSEALARQANNPHGNVLFYLAMTYQASGDAKQARQFFKRGEKWLAEQKQAPRPIPQQLRSEAQQLLSKGSGSRRPP